MEGVSHEAASMAGHMRLGRLIVLFDDNSISIDGDTSLAVSDDISGRFTAYDWQVLTVDTMYVGLLVIAVLGFLFSLVLDEIEHRLIPWKGRV